MSESKIDALYHEYSEIRFLEINKEQFVYLVNLIPCCLLAANDGVMNKEQWSTIKSLTKTLGEEKEERLMLIYQGEMRYMIKHRDKWESKFIRALREYFKINQAAKDFVEETLEQFEGQAEKAEVTQISVSLGLSL